SATAQFCRSPVPVFFTVIVIALLPFTSRSAQAFVTTRPGVWHWKFASSNAVACTSPGVGVQSHVTVALSGSAAESVAEHAALFAPDVNTHAPLTHVACALPQSTSARQAPASDLTLTVPGNPGLPSPIEQFRRSALPALPTAYRTLIASAATAVPSTVNAFQPRQRSVCPSSSALTNPTSWKVSPPSQDTCLSTFATHVFTPPVRSLIRTKGSSMAESCSTPFVRSAVRL